MTQSPRDSNLSVTQLIFDLKAGEVAAAERIWNLYFERLIRAASRRMSDHRIRVADEEDVVISVFDSLCRGAAKGRFQQLQSRTDLWQLLCAITKQKVVDKIRHETRQKRGGGQVRGESVFLNAGSNGGIGMAGAPEPTPADIVEFDDQFQYLLGLLGNDTLRKVAMLRMEGFSNDEIATEIQMSTKSVERKLKLIRQKWERELTGF